jgi:LysM repeat protein
MSTSAVVPPVRSAARARPGHRPAARPGSGTPSVVPVAVRHRDGRGYGGRSAGSLPHGGRPGPVRLTRRGRVVVVGFALAVSLVGSFLVLRDSSVATDREGERSFRTVTVAPGETLWDIAREVAPQADPRDTIDLLVKYNALLGVTVQPGQELRVPEPR